jgi:hypothetical protein
MKKLSRIAVAGTAAAVLGLLGGAPALAASAEATGAVSQDAQSAGITVGVVVAVHGHTLIIDTNGTQTTIDIGGAAVNGKLNVGVTVSVLGLTIDGVIKASLVTVL